MHICKHDYIYACIYLCVEIDSIGDYPNYVKEVNVLAYYIMNVCSNRKLSKILVIRKEKKFQKQGITKGKSQPVFTCT